MLDLVESTRVEAFKIRRSEVDREELAAPARRARHPLGQPRHPRVQPLLAAGQPRRGHPPRAPPALPPPRGLAAADGQPRRHLPRCSTRPTWTPTSSPGSWPAPWSARSSPRTRPRCGARRSRRCSGRSPTSSASATGPPPARATTSEWSGQLWRSVLTLWQTALLRLSRLRLQDEIDEALRYYELSLFDVVPAINAELRRALDERWPDAGLLPRPMLLPGSWIGGDRDGNPFVTADALRRATYRQAEAALGHHLGELEALRSELSMSDRLVTPTPRALPPRRGARGTTRRSAPTSPTGGRWAASPPGWRPPRTPSSAACPARRRTRHAPAVRVPRRAARRPRRRRHVAAQPRRRRARRRPAAAACARRSRSSASTCAGWTCGRTPPSTRRSSPSCSPGPGCATTTRPSTRRPGSSCWPAS